MRKKQTVVSHSSTESESVTQTSDITGRPVDIERNRKSQGKINVLNNIDCVPSNVQSSRQEALLYTFEDK